MCLSSACVSGVTFLIDLTLTLIPDSDSASASPLPAPVLPSWTAPRASGSPRPFPRHLHPCTARSQPEGAGGIEPERSLAAQEPRRVGCEPLRQSEPVWGSEADPTSRWGEGSRETVRVTKRKQAATDGLLSLLKSLKHKLFCVLFELVVQ